MRLRTVALAAGLMAATIPSMTVPADAAWGWGGGWRGWGGGWRGGGWGWGGLGLGLAAGAVVGTALAATTPWYGWGYGYPSYGYGWGGLRLSILRLWLRLSRLGHRLGNRLGHTRWLCLETWVPIRLQAWRPIRRPHIFASVRPFHRARWVYRR
jgi:hypothetical protein